MPPLLANTWAIAALAANHHTEEAEAVTLTVTRIVTRTAIVTLIVGEVTVTETVILTDGTTGTGAIAVVLPQHEVDGTHPNTGGAEVTLGVHQEAAARPVVVGIMNLHQLLLQRRPLSPRILRGGKVSP